MTTTIPSLPSRWLIALGLCCLAASTSRADQNDDEAAIRKSVDTYLAAFNGGDAKALAAHWMPEAVYVDPDSGRKIVGRAAIEKHFAEELKELKGSKLTVTVESIRFISPHVALEQGTATILGPNKEPSSTSYKAIHIKQEGKWLLDRVTEEDSPTTVSRYEQLKDLEWLVGSWRDADDNAATTVETVCQWSKNGNFLVRTFNVSVRDQLASSGVQIIGWDPALKRIRSWVFDSEGGFGEGLWTKKGKSWHIYSRDTLANGRKASAVNIITFVDKDSFTWQSVDRQVAGQLLPNIGTMTAVRTPRND